MPKLDQYTDLYGGGDSSVKGSGGDFTTFEDGVYKVNGIAKFFTVDTTVDPPLPVFVPNFDGNMVARANLRLAEAKDGSVEGPPWSGTRAEICAYVTAVGGDVSSLPVGETTAFLLAAQKAANDAAEIQLAHVKGGKGWARYVEGATPPEETFLWGLLGGRGLDRKNLTFQTKTEEWRGKKIEKDVIMLQVAIAGKANGQPSPYSSYKIEIELRQPFDGYRYKADGKPIPQAIKGANGGLLPSVKNFFNWLDIFWPEHWNWEWQEDPEQSPYGINELDNPIVVFIGEAVKAKKTAHAKLSMADSGRPYLKLDDFSKSGLDGDAPTATKASDPIELFKLVQAIEKSSGTLAFKATPTNSDTINVEFSEEGKKWAKEILVQLWSHLKLPLSASGKRQLRDLSIEQMVTLTGFVEKAAGLDADEVKLALIEQDHDEAF